MPKVKIEPSWSHFQFNHALNTGIMIIFSFSTEIIVYLANGMR